MNRPTFSAALVATLLSYSIPAWTQERIVVEGIAVEDRVVPVPLLAEERPADPKSGEETKAEPAIDIPRSAPVPLGPKHIRLHLIDGSVISGDLSVSEITVETSFGKLVVPVANIRSFTPGLDSNPQKISELQKLIENLGSDDYKTREQAHKDLSAMGMRIQKELEVHANSDNAEIKRHVGEILKELEEQAEEVADDEESTVVQPWIRLDTVVTSEFTVVGKVSPKEFAIQSKYGPLNVQLADVRMAERETGAKEPFRKNVVVDGANIAQRNFKSSGVRVQVGDRIIFKADGSIVMSPWGSNATTGPDGAPNYGWYMPNSIPGGALVARIGDKGQIFKVGRQLSVVAKSSGILQLAIGIQAEYANEGYNYPGQFSVKLRIEPK